MILFNSFFLAAIILMVTEIESIQYLHSPFYSTTRSTEYWGPRQACPSNSFVTKVTLGTGYNSDDVTALSGLKMECTSLDVRRLGKTIHSATGRYNSWKHYPIQCKGLVTGFQLRSSRDSGLSDFRGATDIRILCSDGKWLDGNSGWHSYSEWTERQICPTKTAICSMKTRIDDNRVNFWRDG